MRKRIQTWLSHSRFLELGMGHFRPPRLTSRPEIIKLTVPGGMLFALPCCVSSAVRIGQPRGSTLFFFWLFWFLFCLSQNNLNRKKSYSAKKIRTENFVSGDHCLHRAIYTASGAITRWPTPKKPSKWSVHKSHRSTQWKNIFSFLQEKSFEETYLWTANTQSHVP